MPKQFTKQRVFQLIHDYDEKCLNNIFLSNDLDQLDTSANLCNAYLNTVVSILNYCDYWFIGGHLNIHRPWCKQAFELLKKSNDGLNAAIGLKKEELNNRAPQGSRLGFN